MRVTLPGATAGSVDPSRPARILGLGGEDLVAPPQAPPAGVAGGGGARFYRLDGAGSASTRDSSCACSWRRRAAARTRPSPIRR